MSLVPHLIYKSKTARTKTSLPRVYQKIATGPHLSSLILHRFLDTLDDSNGAEMGSHQNQSGTLIYGKKDEGILHLRFKSRLYLLFEVGNALCLKEERS